MSKKTPARIDPLTLALPLGGVDSHCHLDGAEFDADREEVLTRARQVGLQHVGNVFLGPEDFAVRRQMFAAHPEVFFILGIHPCDGQTCTPDRLAAMRSAFANEPRLRAVGEIGLDFYWDDCPREIQYQALRDQLALARELGRPVVIHCREAEEETLMILESAGFAGFPLLWHCFGQGKDMARRIVRNGWHISVPGPVTYKSNAQLREAVALIPPDRLLLETDAPYLAPLPWRGKRNEPAFTVFTARALAEARGEDVATLWLRCGANARRFFGLASGQETIAPENTA
ncbi:MAG: TatD family hydrolase [Desulfovibrio sp.]|nr:TatD family hydrolase [Desulfovibrio sp.]